MGRVYNCKDGRVTEYCRSCKTTKEIDKFYEDAEGRPDWVSPACIRCTDKRGAEREVSPTLEGLDQIAENLVQIRIGAILDALVKEVIDCPLCLRKGFVFTPPNIVRTCLCHMSTLVRIAGMQNELRVSGSLGGVYVTAERYESVGSEAHGGDDDSLESDGEFQRRGIQEG